MSRKGWTSELLELHYERPNFLKSPFLPFRKLRLCHIQPTPSFYKSLHDQSYSFIYIFYIADCVERHQSRVSATETLQFAKPDILYLWLLTSSTEIVYTPCTSEKLLCPWDGSKLNLFTRPCMSVNKIRGDLIQTEKFCLCLLYMCFSQLHLC